MYGEWPQEDHSAWSGSGTPNSEKATAEAIEDITLDRSKSGSWEEKSISKTQVFLLNISTIPIMFLTLLDAAIISTVSSKISRATTLTSQAIPRIAVDFHSVSDIGWYGAAYQLAKYE